MSAKNEIFEIIKSKGRGKSIHVKTSEYSYWGRLFEYKDETIILKPYYTDKESNLQLHDEHKQLSLNEIVDVD